MQLVHDMLKFWFVKEANISCLVLPRKSHQFVRSFGLTGRQATHDFVSEARQWFQSDPLAVLACSDFNHCSFSCSGLRVDIEWLCCQSKCRGRGHLGCREKVVLMEVIPTADLDFSFLFLGVNFDCMSCFVSWMFKKVQILLLVKFPGQLFNQKYFDPNDNIE